MPGNTFWKYACNPWVIFAVGAGGFGLTLYLTPIGRGGWSVLSFCITALVVVQLMIARECKRVEMEDWVSNKMLVEIASKIEKTLDESKPKKPTSNHQKPPSPQLPDPGNPFDREFS